MTFDQFQLLTEKINLGISSQDLQSVISESDKNENGVIDYSEFVPLAADLIQSFRAQSKARKLIKEEDIQIDDKILSAVSKDEIHTIAELCLMKIREIDKKNYGVIRPSDLRRVLMSLPQIIPASPRQKRHQSIDSIGGTGRRSADVSTAASNRSDRMNDINSTSTLSEREISMICQRLTRDQFGRCLYDNFEEILMQVRFLTFKNNIIDTKGSDLQKYLLNKCKEEEANLHRSNGNANEDMALTGVLPVRSLIRILVNESEKNEKSEKATKLTRLQVLVIMAEAPVLDDGTINYYQFIPIAAKTIDIIFEPKTLRQRAELIEKISYSTDNLLSIIFSEDFETRLSTLFQSYGS